jgi:prepilin-type N-terminal cleavage/methylation domain-containing protein
MKVLGKRKGFTLLELLIVVIIIGILATLAMPRFIKATLTARSAEALTNLGMLRGSEWRYYAEHNDFASLIGNLDIDNPNNVANKQFTYSLEGVSSSGFTAKAEFDADTSKTIEMDEDGDVVKTGF